MKQRTNVFSLLLIVFIDAAGIGILLPIMNTIIMSPTQSILPLEYSVHLRNLLYGITIGCFFLFWFLGATYISKFSDSIGRKRCLLICIGGLFVGYGLTVISIITKSISILIFSRVIAGLTAASQPVAQAAIIDLSNKESKTKMLSLIMFSFCIGMVAGPLISAIFSNNNICIYFNLKFPFIIIMLLCLPAYFITKIYYSDVVSPLYNFKFRIKDILGQFSIILRNKNIFKISASFFFMQFAFNTFYIFISVYLYKKYGFSTFDNGMNFFIMGIGMALSNLLLVPKAKKISNNKYKIVRFCLIFMLIALTPMCIGYALLSVISSLLFVIFFALSYTNMLSIFSDNARDEEQGWIMGITVSIFTLASFLTSFISQETINFNVNSPIYITMISCLLAFLVLFQNEKE